MFELAATLVNLAATEGGWTKRLDGLNGPISGYSVGGNPRIPEKVIHGWRNVPGPALVYVVARYLENAWNTGAGYTGGWVNPEDDSLVLDAPSIVKDLKLAKALGKHQGETAIFDIANGETIYL